MRSVETAMTFSCQIGVLLVLSVAALRQPGRYRAAR